MDPNCPFAVRGYMPHNGVIAVSAMKVVLIILALIVVAGSIWADYRWRKWMAERRRDRH